MLLERFLPQWQFAEHHEVEINAPPDRVYTALLALDLAAIPIVRLLFRLRGLPAARATLADLENTGFIPLGHRPQHEIALGLVGQFWTLTGNLQKMDAAAFAAFTDPAYAKTAWNFTLTPLPAGRTRLATTTRIHCPTPATRRRFTPYWLLIRPFSALIRRLALHHIRRQAQRLTPPPSHTPAG